MRAAIIETLLYCLGAYLCLAAGCEYRFYKGGHRFVKAFYARSFLQNLYTLLQSRDADPGMVTYIGYAGAALFHIAGVFVLPFSIYQGLHGEGLFGMHVIRIWTFGGALWGIAAMLIQGMDSLLNRL